MVILIGRVLHFDINAQNPERAKKFYETVFNWQFTKWEGPIEYWLITTGPDNEPGINGGMSKTNNPGITTSITIDTKDIDDVINKIKTQGGTITQPKNAIPGEGWLISFTDTEGNTLNVMQDDPNAQ